MLSEFLSHPVDFSAEMLCRSIFLMHRHAFSGQMHLKIAAHTHTLCWIDGRLVTYQSNFPAFEWRRLLASNPKAPLLPDYIETPSAIVNEGFVSHEQWQKHLDFCLEQALIVPLSWVGGVLSFESYPIDVRTVDPELLQKILVLPALLKGVSAESHAHFNDIQGSTLLSATEPLARWLFAFQVPNSWSKLAQLLSHSCTLLRILDELDQPEDLKSFLWMLNACRLLRCQETTAVGLSALGLSTADHAIRLSERPTAEEDSLEDRVRSEYQKRMGQDYYAFLGLPGTAEQKVLLQSVRQLIQQWHAWCADVDTIDAVTQTKINSLAFNLYDIWAVFLSADSKIKYDQQRWDGLAPIAGRNRHRLGDNLIPLPEIKILVESGQYAKSFPLLEQQANMHFQDPEILALLGWTRWNLGAYDLGMVMIEVALIFEEGPETHAVADRLLQSAELPSDRQHGLLRLANRHRELRAMNHASRKVGGV